MAHGVPPSRLMLELRTQHNDFPHFAYDLIPPPPLFTLYPLCPRPEMCINPVGTLIKHGWSIYRRPKMSESHYSPYVTTPSGTRQTPTTVPHLLAPLHCTIPGALPSPPLQVTLPAASPAGHLSALVYELPIFAKLWSLKRSLRDLHQEKGAMLTAANMHVAKKSMSTLFRNACMLQNKACQHHSDMHVA